MSALARLISFALSGFVFLNQCLVKKSMLKTPAVDSLWLRLCLSRVADRQAQLEKGDTAAQELVNSLQVLEVMAGAMAAELKSLVRALPCMFIMFQAGMIDTGENSALTGSLSFP